LRIRRKKSICPRCGRKGFPSRRWIRKSYYVKDGSWAMDDPKYFSATTGVYRGKVLGEKQWHFYMGHYDKEAFRNQMVDYRYSKRKSRPNGRKWCMLKIDRDYKEINITPDLFKIKLLKNKNIKRKDIEHQNIKHQNNAEPKSDIRLNKLIYNAKYHKDYRFISAILKKIL
jgi:hypothetical protein